MLDRSELDAPTAEGMAAHEARIDSQAESDRDDDQDASSPIKLETPMDNVKERPLVPPGGMNGRVLPAPHAWEAIPEYTIDALIEYVEHGRPVGSFLYAVLVGDLFGTLRSADDRNRHCIEDILRWLRNVPPASCYGSEAKVKAWVALHQRSVKLRDCPTWQDFVRQWEAVR